MVIALVAWLQRAEKIREQRSLQACSRVLGEHPAALGASFLRTLRLSKDLPAKEAEFWLPAFCLLVGREKGCGPPVPHRTGDFSCTLAPSVCIESEGYRKL